MLKHFVVLFHYVLQTSTAFVQTIYLQHCFHGDGSGRPHMSMICEIWTDAVKLRVWSFDLKVLIMDCHIQILKCFTSKTYPDSLSGFSLHVNLLSNCTELIVSTQIYCCLLRYPVITDCRSFLGLHSDLVKIQQ